MYIVIEKHGGAQYATIVTDENGDNKVFENKADAQIEADDCLDGMVIQMLY